MLQWDNQPRDSTGAANTEQERFDALQSVLAHQYEAVFDDPNAPRTVLILPSLSLDPQVMAKVSGVAHYEERMLCLLMLLRLPRTRVIYVSSTPISSTIIDYYLHLLPGVPSEHARRRLTLLSCDDSQFAPLTQKILDRPRLLQRVKEAIGDPVFAHMTCFTVSELERRLALALGIPIYGCDPALLHWGSKSGSRKIFREAGIDYPAGYEDLSTMDDIAYALSHLKAARHDLAKAVVKINEGFSGEGNAVLDFSGAPQGSALLPWVKSRLPDLAFEAKDMTFELYEDKLTAMGGIVEEWIPGAVKESPSVQFRVDPLRRLEIISTHDQVLGGKNGQIFLGARFPASDAYRLDIQRDGQKAAQALAQKGVLGRFGIDFVSVKHNDAWRHIAIEINLRKGGTTHPFQMLQFLTDGHYDPTTGIFLAPSGRPRCYYASDNLESENYRGLTPDDLIDISVLNGLHFNAAKGEGVAFHLIGALSEFGKLGIVAIGETHERADALYRKSVVVLDREGGRK
ncbi:MAG: carboxylate-amine ligase [Hyphomicrobium sp. 32-62-53]|nr:MAG: carboxylate-amine ligase [Hyphomicrobium sp. 12-62-95]OYY01257.1 MAG: carboxylate-amine ligase [Hyphomicrobium sp. 32-62-53]